MTLRYIMKQKFLVGNVNSFLYQILYHKDLDESFIHVKKYKNFPMKAKESLKRTHYEMFADERQTNLIEQSERFDLNQIKTYFNFELIERTLESYRLYLHC